mgnify:CR=1 FL=1
MTQRDAVISYGNTQNIELAGSGNSLYGKVYEAQDDWYSDILDFMGAFSKGEEIEFRGGVRCDLGTMTGITVATQYIDLKRSLMELVTKTFEFVKSFEKSLSNSI